MPDDRPEPPRLVRDVEALKVFTHPLRFRLFRLLYTDGPATASELGRIVDATPSLVSYHMRTMAKHGFIAEAPEASGDGRERRWRVERDLRFNHTDFADDPAAWEVANTVVQVLHSERNERYEAAMRRLRSMSREWQDATFGAGPTVRLTAAELAQLSEELMAVVDRYRGRPAVSEDGEPRERVLLEMIGFPYEP